MWNLFQLSIVVIVVKMTSKVRNFYLLGRAITSIDSVVNLPTCKEALRLFCHFHFILGQTLQNSAKSTVDVVLNIYRQNGVPVILRKNAAKKLLTLNTEWVNVKKSKKRHQKQGTSGKPQNRKIRNFCIKLEKVFDIAPKNVQDQIKDDDVKRFWISQKYGSKCLRASRSKVDAQGL